MVGWAMTAYAFGYVRLRGLRLPAGRRAHRHRLLVAGGLLIALAEALLTAVSTAGCSSPTSPSAWR